MLKENAAHHRIYKDLRSKKYVKVKLECKGPQTIMLLDYVGSTEEISNQPNKIQITLALYIFLCSVIKRSVNHLLDRHL